MIRDRSNSGMPVCVGLITSLKSGPSPMGIDEKESGG